MGTHKDCKFKSKMMKMIFMMMDSCKCLNGLQMEIIKKETHENNRVQPEDNNINVLGFNVCLLLVQITVWIGMARKVKTTRKELRRTK